MKRIKTYKTHINEIEFEPKERRYRILIKYTTGDSFSEIGDPENDREEYIELTWNNLEIAEENLNRIEEHYKMYKDIESPIWNNRKNEKQILGSNKGKPWFVNHFPTYCIKLKADNGNEMQMSCFWCGYFETLTGAEIMDGEECIKFF